MKVRKGNDIRLTIKLAFKDGYANIHEAQAFFINTTLKEKLDAEYKKKNRFIGRFPIEPFVDEFQPTAYNINSSGGIYDVYVVNPYNGFGINPDWKKCMPIAEENITVYRSEITNTNNPSEIIVEFPGEAQMYTGVYQLLITAKVFDPGYSHNSRTVTANYNDVFELVEDSQTEATDNPVQINIVR